MDKDRWAYYRRQVEAKAWRPGQDLVNNRLRRFKTLCRRAGVGPYTLHDLRRSCITNWARALPTHVVQQLAGHSDIQTTETYYLSVQEDDLAKARRVQGELVGRILKGTGLTHSLTHCGPDGLKNGHGENSPPAEASGGQS